MMAASVAPPALALARPAAAFLRTRLLSRGDALAGSASRPASGCRVARGGGARRPQISFAAGGGAGPVRKTLPCFCKYISLCWVSPKDHARATRFGKVGDAFVVEGTTNVKFSRELMVPGSTEPLIILGTGYRDKFFVKVYAAAFYVDYSIGIDTEKWREKVAIETFDASTVFDSIFKAPIVKALSITLVRDVDGKTFVKALDEVIARRIKEPTVEEESSLSTFRNIFLGRNLKQGTSIYLTWSESSVMLISISTDQGACQVDAEIKSASVNYALYDGFFGSSPVSPSLKSSTAQLLEALLTK